MNIGEIENLIIEILQKAFPEREVSSFPTKFEDYTFTSPIGCLLVKYNYTNFSEQKTIWQVVQNGTVKFSVIAGYRGLFSFGETHETQQKIRNVLKGLEIFGKKIVLRKEEFLAEINGDVYVGLECSIQIEEEDENDYEI